MTAKVNLGQQKPVPWVEQEPKEILERCRQKKEDSETDESPDVCESTDGRLYPPSREVGEEL